MTTVITPPEQRTYAARLTELDSSHSLRTLVGRAVPYNTLANVGWYLEQMNEGVFAKSTREAARSLPLLLWHDSHSLPIGLSASWDSRSDGLWGEWSLDASPEAQDAARAARDGRLGWLSVGFAPIISKWVMSSADEWDPDNVATLDQVTRIEARLIETSLTPTPAYEDAQVAEVRTAEYCRRARRGAAPVAVHAGQIPSSVRPPVSAELAELRRWRASMTSTDTFRQSAAARR